jgi:hypothetical protein
MTDGMVQLMQRSGWLRTELQDSGLRQLLIEIATASNICGPNKQTHQEQALQKAKLDYPHFKRFIDKLLVLTTVLERQREDTEIHLADWLSNETAKDAHPLILKPIAGRPKIRVDAKEKEEKDADETDDSGSDDDSDSGSDGSSSESSNSVHTR